METPVWNFLYAPAYPLFLGENRLCWVKIYNSEHECNVEVSDRAAACICITGTLQCYTIARMSRGTQTPAPCATFYLYTFLTSGESAAWQNHNCNGAFVYQNMPVHYDVQHIAAWDNAMDFLPVTQFTYKIPVMSYTSSPMYTNVLGFVSMNRYPEETQDIMVASRGDRRYSGARVSSYRPVKFQVHARGTPSVQRCQNYYTR